MNGRETQPGTRRGRPPDKPPAPPARGEMPPDEEGPRRDLVRRVRRFLAALFAVPEEQITLDTPVLEDERNPADSLDVVELVMAIEEEFGLELRDQDAEALTLEVVARWTVRDLVNFIERCGGWRSPPR
jgi:acyl carrier protein